ARRVPRDDGRARGGDPARDGPNHGGALLGNDVIKRPKRLVLVGRSLGHSLSPTFQNAALQQAALPLRYETLDIPASALDDALQELAAQDAAGNVTVPYKQAIFSRCDRLMPPAARAQAVNTFW